MVFRFCVFCKFRLKKHLHHRGKPYEGAEGQCVGCDMRWLTVRCTLLNTVGAKLLRFLTFAE